MNRRNRNGGGLSQVAVTPGHLNATPWERPTFLLGARRTAARWTRLCLCRCLSVRRYVRDSRQRSRRSEAHVPLARFTDFKGMQWLRSREH